MHDGHLYLGLFMLLVISRLNALNGAVDRLIEGFFRKTAQTILPFVLSFFLARLLLN